MSWCIHKWEYHNTYLKSRTCEKCGKYQMWCEHKKKYEDM